MVAATPERATAAPQTGSAGRLYLTCTLAGGRYLVAAGVVREVEEVSGVTPIPAAPSWLRGVMNLRGTIVAVADLATFLGMESTGTGAEALICVTGEPTGASGEDQFIALAVEAVSTIRSLGTDELLPLTGHDRVGIDRYLAGLYRTPARDGAAGELLGVLDLEALLTALLGSLDSALAP
jgi:purine-binding chemotaxis protein CheW